MKQAVLAKCYDCTGFFADGENDCSMPSCPLHPFMVFNKNRAKKTTSRTLTNLHMEKMRAARQKESRLLR